jgi:hypothetical protein
LEAERRKQEQEHELRMLSIMMGNVSQTRNPSLNVSPVFYPQAYTPIQQHTLGGPSYMQAPLQAPKDDFENGVDGNTYFKL